MVDDFKIYVDRLREGRDEKILFTVAPAFLGMDEFQTPVEVSGVAYLADTQLIVRLTIKTVMTQLCAICNDPVGYPIDISDMYQPIELAKIAHLVFNFEDLVRDAILLQLPYAVECGGACPEREQLSNYFSRRS